MCKITMQLYKYCSCRTILEDFAPCPDVQYEKKKTDVTARFITDMWNDIDLEFEGTHYISWSRMVSGSDSVFPKGLTCTADRLAEYVVAENCPLCGNARVLKVLERL